MTVDGPRNPRHRLTKGQGGEEEDDDDDDHSTTKPARKGPRKCEEDALTTYPARFDIQD